MDNDELIKIAYLAWSTKLYLLGRFCLTGSSRRGTVEMNPTRNHEVVSSIPCLAQWVKDLALPRAEV